MEALPDELVEAILLRSPPDDPVLLARAALVCKRWCRLVSDPGFRRRFRQFHRTAPMLGLLHNTPEDEEGFLFVPTSSFFPSSHGGVEDNDSKRFRQVVDARHGRVLLHGIGRRSSWSLREDMFAVWDPITGHETVLPTPSEYVKLFPRWSAAVLCAGDNACDHLDCHRGPFQVVIVCCDGKQSHACVYSSVTGAWRQPASSLLLHRYACLDRDSAIAFVCGALFFEFGTDPHPHLLRYDLASEEMWVIHHPPDASSGQYNCCITTDQDGRRLGYATVEGYKLYLWSREAVHGGNWTDARVIELEKLLPADVVGFSIPDISFSIPLHVVDVVGFSVPLHVVGFADGVGVFVVDTNSGRLFTIDLKSSQVNEVCDVSDDATGDIPSHIFPYMTFLTPNSTASSLDR